MKRMYRLLGMMVALTMVFPMLFSVAAAEKTVIEYSCMFSQGEPHAIWLEQLSKNYEADTGIKVDITFIGRDVLTKIKSRILTNDPPDIVDNDMSELYAAFLGGGETLLTEMDDFIDTENYDKSGSVGDQFNRAMLEMYAKDGSIYMIPFIFITSGFFYNKTLFEEAGISIPTTWDEFISIGETLKAAGIPMIAQDGQISFYNAYYYYWAVQRVMGAGNFLRAAQDKTGAAWDEPGFLEAAKMVYELSKGGKNYFVSGYEGSAYPAGQADWAMGGAAVNLNGSWLPNEVRELVDDEWQWGFFPFPVVEDGVGKVTDMEAYTLGWSIPKGAKHPQEAMDFLRYATGLENANESVDVTLNMSANKDAKSPEVLSEVGTYLANAESFHLSYDGVMSQASQWWADIFYNLDNQLFFGMITPEEFITQIKAESIEFYKNK